MTTLPLLDAISPADWPTFTLISARVSGMFLVAPLWSMTTVPKPVRAALAVVISLVLVPGAARPHLPNDPLGMPGMLAAEGLIGLAIGITASLFLHGIALAGEVASVQMGLSLGPLLGPMPEAAVAGVGEIKSMLALALYVTLGGHLSLLESLGRSLQLIPPGGSINLVGGAKGVVTLGGSVFSAGIMAAAPVMVALLLTNVALAILSRAVPQLSAMAVAFPVTVSVGLVMLAASLPFLSALIGRWVNGLPVLLDSTLQGLMPLATVR
jgi:flagellar biosynthetic protein FliR